MTHSFRVRTTAGPALALLAGALALAAAAPLAGAQGWEPSRGVTLVVPASQGGAADRVARQIQHIVNKYGLTPTPMRVVYKPRGLGVQGYLNMQRREGDPHTLLVAPSNIFTTPRLLGAPFHWAELTPVAMAGTDPFVLWVNADSPYRTAQDYLAAAAAGSIMGGAGVRQEGELIARALERVSPARFRYLPFAHGDEVALRLAGGHVDSGVGNPIEAVDLWRAGRLRPLCVFGAGRLPYDAVVAGGMAWRDIPTCREAGVDVAYETMRGVFMPARVSPEQAQYFTDLLARVMQTPEWQEFTAEGALIPGFRAGPDFVAWLNQADAEHQRMSADVGLMPTTQEPVAAAHPGAARHAPGPEGR